MSLEEISREGGAHDTAALHPICADLDVRLHSFAVPRGRLAALVTEPAGTPDDRAQRPPVLLLPGYTGSKEDFRRILEPLTRAGHRVVALDQRGQFQSPGGPQLDSYTTSALAEDVLAVVDDLGPVHLVGHSFGGLVARAAALARPAAFRSVVLMCSGPAALTGPRVAVLPLMRPLLEQGMPTLVAAMDQLNAADAAWLALDAPVQVFLRERMLAASPHALIGMGDALTGEPDRVDELRATGLPVLVLHGERDDAWTPADQEEMARRLGCAYAVVPGSAHSPAVEAPEPTARELLGFWTGLS